MSATKKKELITAIALYVGSRELDQHFCTTSFVDSVLEEMSDDQRRYVNDFISAMEDFYKGVSAELDKRRGDGK